MILDPQRDATRSFSLCPRLGRAQGDKKFRFTLFQARFRQVKEEENALSLLHDHGPGPTCLTVSSPHSLYRSYHITSLRTAVRSIWCPALLNKCSLAPRSRHPTAGSQCHSVPPAYVGCTPPLLSFFPIRPPSPHCLTKQATFLMSNYNTKSGSVKRLLKEAREMEAEACPSFAAEPLEVSARL